MYKRKNKSIKSYLQYFVSINESTLDEHQDDALMNHWNHSIVSLKFIDTPSSYQYIKHKLKVGY